MELKSLPIGISTLSTIREENMLYIDKTTYAFSLINRPGRFFLSRPRRFGKSLFVDTLKEIFEGNKDLFKGLFIHDKWDWTRKFPVIKIDFAGGLIKSTQDLEYKLAAKIHSLQRKHSIELEEKGISNQFHELIDRMVEKYNSKLVILIDEYDKPLLDNIEAPPRAAEIREGLKNFYSVIKEQDAHLQFVFITGVSKFSKVSIFSGINNLKDITLSEKYAAICGYTQSDLESDFASHLAGVDWEKLKEWYNGYNFLGERVYNPFDILLFISENQSYRNYWFESGTPSFLIKLLKEDHYFLPELDNIEVGEEILSSFEIDSIEPETLLFQAGYLTIKKVYTKLGHLKFQLTYPNFEVKTSFNNYLISGYTDITTRKLRYEEGIYDSLMAGDIPLFEKTIKRLFAGIPWRNFTNNDLIEFEGYYASVLYAFFSAINCTVIPEDITLFGQADLTIQLGGYTYVMEIKIDDKAEEKDENEALNQIKEMDYAAKYLNTGKGVYELGLIFSPKARNLVKFDWKKRE